MFGDESLDLFAVLAGKDRAGRVEEFTAAGEERPQRPEQPFLLGGESVEILGTTQPLGIGVATDDARRWERKTPPPFAP